MKMTLYEVVVKMLSDYKQNKIFNESDIDELLYLIYYLPEHEARIKEFEYKNKYVSAYEGKQSLVLLLKEL